MGGRRRPGQRSLRRAPVARAIGCALWLVAAGGAAGGELARSFLSSDQNPLVALHGLPLPAEPLLDAPDWTWSLSLDVSNTLNDEQVGDERLFFDGETQRLSLGLQRRLGADWGLRATLALVAHGAGRLDAFIDDFHSLFGFPQGGRSTQPRNRLLFLHSDTQGEGLRFETPRSGLGDLSLALGRDLPRGPDRRLQLWGQIKLPTGTPGDLTGSGAPGAALWVQDARRLAAHWSVVAHAGVLAMGRGEVLAERQRRLAGFGRLGLAWELVPRFALQVELHAHTAFYDSDTALLGESLQIVTGGWLGLGPDSRLDVAVVEDIAVGSAPDVTFHFAWRGRW